MRKYRVLASAMLQRTIVERVEAWLGLLGGIFALLAVYYVWRSVYGERNGVPIAGFDFAAMKAYLIVSLAAMSLVTFDWTIASRVRAGEISFDLVKPIDFQKARFAEGVGGAVFELVSVAATALVLATLLGGVYLPARPLTWLLFAVSFLLVIPLQFGIVYPVALLNFWVLWPYGLTITRIAIVSIFSGAVIPLTFFPHWFRTLSAVLPFRGIVYTPSSIYLERVSTDRALVLIGHQLLWTVVLWFVSRLVWRTVVRTVAIQGG